jgi:hypothetical protein
MNGLWVWQLKKLTPSEVVDMARRMGCRRVICKTRDGRKRMNAGLVGPLAEECKKAGLELWVWAWVYPRNPSATRPDAEGDAYVQDQAALLAQDCRDFGAAGVVANAEAPFSWSLNHKWAAGHLLAWGNEAKRRDALKHRGALYIQTLRALTPSQATVGLSTFPLPRNHKLPFAELASGADVIMPQFYFRAGASTYEERATKSAEQWSALVGPKPLRYTGPIFRGARSAANVIAALNAARSRLATLGLPTPLAHSLDWWTADRLDSERASIEELLGDPPPHLR